MSVSEYKRRIKIIGYNLAGKNEYGSPVKGAIATQWDRWAKVEDRSGFQSTNEQQQTWSYDTKITVRHEPTQQIKSNMYVEYEGALYAIRDVQTKSEGYKVEDILRVEKTDEVI